MLFRSVPAERLFSNDIDVDNNRPDFSIISVLSATHGEVSLVDGDPVFTPELNYSGPAQFMYTVSDGSGGVGIRNATNGSFISIVVSGTDVQVSVTMGPQNVQYIYQKIG